MVRVWGSEVVVQYMTLLYLFMAQVFRAKIDVDVVRTSLEVTRTARVGVEQGDVVRAAAFEMFASMVASSVLTPAISEVGRSQASKLVEKNVLVMFQLLLNSIMYRRSHKWSCCRV